MLTFLCFAQTVRFRHITVEDGLTQNSVSFIHQDKRGFMWIGSYDGLNKYDGNRFITWKGKPDDTSTIASNTVKCFYEEGDNFWVGTYGGGMFCINMRTNKVKNYLRDSTKPNTLSSDIVNAITSFEEGKIWIATADGLNILDKASGKITVIRKDGPNAIPMLSNSIRAMVKDNNGIIWFAHANTGITRYDPKTKSVSYYTANEAPRKLQSNLIRTIFLDSRGWLWVSEWINGQEIIDTKTGNIISPTTMPETYGEFSKASMISGYYEDKKGNMWLATAELGLAWFNPKTNESKFFKNNPDDPETISANTVMCVTEDHSGLIWSGTWKGGVNILDPKSIKFGLFRHNSLDEKSIHDNRVQAFCRNTDDKIYVGTSAGVTVFNLNNTTFSPLPFDDREATSMRHNSSVLHLLQDDDSTLWICTGGGGLYRYLPKQKKYENYIYGPRPSDLSSHSPSCAFKDSKNRLWILTLGGGLNRFNYDTKTFTRYYHDAADETTLSSNDINSVLERNDGKLWIGSGDNGLNLFDPETGKVKRFITDKNGKRLFPDLSVTSLHRDRKGRMWIATGAGLCIFNEKNETAEWIKEHHPIFSSVIYALAEDNSGNIWFSTSMGLCRFNAETEEYKIFNTGDGLQGREFNLHAVYKHGSKLFFGGINGMNVFIPEDIRINAISPLVAITGFSVMNENYHGEEDIVFRKEITLNYSQYFFSFDFACLDFTNPSKNKYAYKLEGFNDSWVDIGDKHSVTFTNLDPGEYTFKVKAANNDNFWSSEAVAVKITITPPFWRTIWFYCLSALFAALGLFLYIRLRERKLMKEKIVLEEKVTERTAELQDEKRKVEAAHKDIKDSIQYAQKIQSAILPAEEEFRKHLREFFILFRPKDIVSGDFYWISEVKSAGGEEFVFYAAADCTGHGVPGGFMTMLGHGLLNELVNEKKMTEPAEILDALRERIILSLKQTGRSGENKDGMDIVLCRYNKRRKKLCYAAANNTCVVVSGDELKEFAADKQPVGIYGDVLKPFSQTEIELKDGDVIYTFTDGYADQFGGPKGKKLKYKNLLSLLQQSARLPVHMQERFLDSKFQEWKGEMEQLDDVLVIGVRV